MGGKTKRVQDEEGLLYPLDNHGSVSTTLTGKQILAAGTAAVSPEVAQAVIDEKQWRDNYPTHFLNNLQLAASSPAAALSCAQGSLDYCYSNFRYVRNGVTKPLNEALDTFHPQGEFETYTQVGANIRNPPPLGVPYQEDVLDPESFLQLANHWSNTGVIEESALESWKWVLKHKRQVKSGLDDTIFVVCGAGAALGPFKSLMEVGASVAAIDLDRPKIWKRLMGIASESPGGILFAPSCDGELGCNLLTQLPEIAHWLTHLEPSKKLVIGCYAYADGERFVRVSLAMDVLVKHLCANRQNKDICLSYLCSPTDCFLVPQEIRDNSMERYNSLSVATALQPVVSTASGGRFMQSNFPVKDKVSERERIADCFVIQQGPNYALAKRIQHYRAVLARHSGFMVSSNIAPASSTESVTKNALLQAGYNGAGAFPPVYIFEPETANHVMTLSLMYDLFNPESVAHPEVPLTNPFDLFAVGAVHGGLFRMPFKLRTVLEVAVCYHYANRYKGLLSVGLGALYAYKRSKL